ncbi:MAG: hypothetical protein KGR26_13295, partial [Cyanobacteria bacterium REEB65]|nr:hypothetical protein [Cyanobacteria bacterium REEB65]
QERLSFSVLSGAFRQEDAATLAISVSGVRLQAETEIAVARARAAAVPANSLETSIADLAPETPGSPCPGLAQADALFLDYLKSNP